MGIKDWAFSIINLGVGYHELAYAKRQTRLLNVLISISVLVLLPVIIVFNASQQVYAHVYLGFGSLAICIFCWVLSARGKTIVAGNILILFIMAFIVLTTLVSDVQSAAPYTFLPLMVAILHFKTGVSRSILLSLSIIAFAWLNFYQIANLPFEAIHYLPAIPTLALFFIGFYFSEREVSRYQEEIEQQNVELVRRNETIQQQAAQLIESEKKRHEQEILLKQKDLDTILANVSFQEKLTENVIRQLSKSVKGDSLEKDVKNLIYELRSQLERIDKLSFLQDNLEEINASLYARLLEKHPSLTKSELELCALIRLGLSVKEVAAARGSTENSTMVLRSRLRKKLELQDQSLTTYLLNF